MNPFLRWLNNTPTANPVDRRNAPFLQVLLLFFGIFVPINKAIFLFAVFNGSAQHLRPGNLQLFADLATDLLLVASAWIALWLIRRGHFRRGVTLFLTVATLCVGIAYASVGLARVGLDPIPLVLLSLAGLVMGRRSMWLMLASLAVMLMVCVVLGTLHPDPVAPAVAVGKAISIAGIWLIITLVLDRTVTALRSSLEESEQRGRSLQQAYLQLQEETAERERIREQLIHSQKMDAAGRLASGLAHDFNNVLSIVLGHAQQRERLAEEGGAPALVSALEGVELAARRALAISRKLLNFSRQEVASPVTFDAGKALQELQPMLHQLLGGRIRLLMDAPQMPLPIHMDRDHFELMLLNIAGNSRHALGETGTFRIGVTHDTATNTLSLALSDDGPGMPEAVRAHAFDPFFTTKPLGEGSGLGLSVVRDMVVKVGGEIGIECPPEGGTTVWIRLPSASMPA